MKDSRKATNDAEMKRVAGKLRLSRETLRELDSGELKEVVGGTRGRTEAIHCGSVRCGNPTARQVC